MRIAFCLLLLTGLAMGNQELPALAAEFRELRTIRGWFSGGDAWVDAVDSWDGRKHRVMGRLAELLGDGQHTRAEVEKLLGAPDEAVRPASPTFRFIQGEADLALVYRWRGMHDFLYFRCVGDRVVGYGWWMAGE
ncbi:MAG: hypothetical protein AB1758_35880 [Candidatus Eremiobacterota bacterium]